jgi:3,4-dihydroxy 2-butanone 4-phosphate synthase/GTP cyclohydrolase II
MSTHLDMISTAIDALAQGRYVIVLDENDRETEAALIFPAATATAEQMAYLMRNSTGIIGVAVPGEVLDRLGIPPMTAINQHSHGIGMAVSVDARNVRGNGASAADRALTARVIADPNARRTDVVRPGCMFPYRAVSGGVLRRTGCVEAAVDLFKIGGMPAAAVTAELVNDDGSLMNGAQARTFAQASDIPLVTIPQLVQHRMSNERAIERVAEAELPTDFGMFRMIGYRSLVDDAEHVALVAGDISSGEDVLVRVHAECLLGDVVCSTRCKCNARLHRSMQRIQDEGRGALIYTRAQAAQGSGLLARITAYSVGDDASSHLPPTDVKNYGTGSQILKDLGVHSMRLLTGAPDRPVNLESFGLSITGVEAI